MPLKKDLPKGHPWDDLYDAKGVAKAPLDIETDKIDWVTELKDTWGETGQEEWEVDKYLNDAATKAAEKWLDDSKNESDIIEMTATALVGMMEKPKPVEMPSKPDCVCSECDIIYGKMLKAYNEYVDKQKAYDLAIAEKDKEKEAKELKKELKKQLAIQQAVVDDLDKKKYEHTFKNLKITQSNSPGWTQKLVTSKPTGSHAKGGLYGGVSKYSDADVKEARAYMQDVLQIEEMSINGRDLAHILAEVVGFRVSDLSEAKKKCMLLEEKVSERTKAIEKLKNTLEQVQYENEGLRQNALLNIQSDKHKVDEHKVDEVETGRRIKDV